MGTGTLISKQGDEIEASKVLRGREKTRQSGSVVSFLKAVWGGALAEIETHIF